MTAARDLLSHPFAHRGLHTEWCPENSRAAFDAAIERGFGIELDVRLSADGVPVVFHDAGLRRMCGIDGRVSTEAAARLTRIRLLDSEETIPTLAQAMHAIAGRAPVLVDLKATLGQRARMADAVAILLRAYAGPVGVVGFDPWLLAGLRVRAPRLPRGQSAGVDPRVVSWWGMRQACYPVDELWSARWSRPDFITFNVDRMPSTALSRMRHSVPAVAWTVRTASAYARARQFADAVIVEGEAVGLAERLQGAA